MKMRKNNKLLIFASLIFIVLLILKLFLVFNTPLGFNEATYYSIAKSIPQGKLPYLDAFDHKPPLVYYLLTLFLGIFGFSVTSMHVLTLLLDAILAVSVFLLVRGFFSKGLAIIAALISFSLVTNVYYDTELPMAILGLSGFLFYLKSFKSRSALFLFVSGIFLALSVWFKQPGILFFLAILVHQIFLIRSGDRRLRKSLRELYFIIAGAIVISLPIISYFVYKIGWGTLFFHIITFNAKFSGATSRLLQAGKLVKMLVFNLGVFLTIIIFYSKDMLKEKLPRKNRLFLIFLAISLIFFLLNREIFYMHLYSIIPIIAFLTITSLSLLKEEKTKQLVTLIILVVIVGFFFFNLEAVARNYRSGVLEQKNIIIQNVSLQVQNSRIFSDSPVYYVLLNKACEYKVCVLAPSVASVFSFEDFCSFSLTREYLILTNRKNYLGQANLDCIQEHFRLVSKFENVDDSYLEVWAKK